MRTVRLLTGVLAVFAGAAACAPARPPELLTFSRVDKAWSQSRGAGALVAVVDWQFDLGRTARAKYVFPVSVVPGENIGAMKPWHGEWMAEIVHTVAPDASVIPINAQSLKQRDYQGRLIEGIRYAADRGAVAVTSSMGPTIQSDALREAIEYAFQKGTLFVDVHPERIPAAGKSRPCAAGECDVRIVHAGIVSVPGHEVAVDPARDVHTWPYDLEPHYKDGWGFSNGPPTIGGVIALIKSANPSLGPAAVREILVETAYTRDGFRVLDAEAAVSVALRASRPSASPAAATSRPGS